MVNKYWLIISLILIILSVISSGNAESVEEMIKSANRHNQAGEYEEAYTIYTEVIEIDPNNTWALNNRAFDLGNMGRWKEALPALNLALNKSPDNFELWQIKAWALYNLKDYEGAIQAIDEVWKLDYKTMSSGWIGETWLLKGRSLVGLGREIEALDAFDKADSYYPTYVKILNEKGLALMNLGRYEEALQSFNQALSINPRYGEAKKNKENAENKLNG